LSYAVLENWTVITSCHTSDDINPILGCPIIMPMRPDYTHPL